MHASTDDAHSLSGARTLTCLLGLTWGDNGTPHTQLWATYSFLGLKTIEVSPWTNVPPGHLDHCLPWTSVPWTYVSLDQRPLDLSPTTMISKYNFLVLF